MASDIIHNILKQIEILTVDQQSCLAAQLAERVRERATSSSRRRKWREIRGLARPSLLAGEDAQQWVSRTRRESDEGRERNLRRAK